MAAALFPRRHVTNRRERSSREVENLAHHATPLNDAVALVSLRLSFTTWTNDVSGKSQHTKQTNHVVIHVNFPPAMLDRSTSGVRMVVVVPAFTCCQQCDEPIVAAVVAGFIIAIAKHMRD